MADDNRIGAVGRISQPQRQAASAPKATQAQTQAQRGMPGLQPPVPTPEQIQRVMAEQARQRQLDMAEAQRRASAMASGQSMEISIDHLTSAKSNSIEIEDSSNRQASIQANNSAQIMTKPIKQLKQFSEPEVDPKIIVPWYPLRSRGISVELEESIIELMPDDLANEGDPQAKVVLALLAEILYLRSVIASGQWSQAEAAFATNSISDLSARVQRLEQSMYSQSVSLQAQARSIHEQVIELQKQGLPPDDILAKITGQSNQKIESGGNQ